MAKNAFAALLAVLIGMGLAQAGSLEGFRGVLRAPDGDPELREHNLVEALGRLRGVPDLGGALLLTEWRDGDLDPRVAEVDRRCRLILANRFQQAVRDVLERGSPSSQSAAVEMVGQIGAAEARNELGLSLAPDLARLAVHGHPSVREATVRALGRIAPEPSVVLPVFRDMMTTGSVPLRRVAAEGVFHWIQVVVQRPAPARPAAPRELVAAAVAFLPVAGLGMQDAEVAIRQTSLATLGNAVAALVPLTTPTETAEIVPLFHVLRNLGPALARILDDSEPTLRLMARQTLEQISRIHSRLPPLAPAIDPWPPFLKTVLPPLARGLGDPDARLRQATLGVLECLDAEASPAAAAIYDALEDTDPLVRRGAVLLVGRIGPTKVPSAVPALIHLLHDGDLAFRLAGAVALERYGPWAEAAVPVLCEMTAETEPLEARVAAMRALAAVGKIGAGVSIPIFVAALADTDASIRLTAVQSLGLLGPTARSTAAALQKLHDDPVPEVQTAADDALRRVSTEEAKKGRE